MSGCYGSKISGSQKTVVLQLWRGKTKNKIDMSDFSAHDCTQEQRGSPNFSSIVRQMAFSVKKDC